MLRLFFGQPEREYTQRDLILLAASGSGAVQREIARLVESGLVVGKTVGAQRRLKANHDAPVFRELCGIFEKTAGVAAHLRESLAELEPDILFAIVYGSVAKGTDDASSDIDVLIVSDSLSLEQVFRALENAERALGRKVSPTLYTSDEFIRRRQARAPFLAKILEGQHEVLFGEFRGD